MGHFRSIKIQLDSEAYRTQTKEVNEHDHSIPLFVSSKPCCHAEFECRKWSIANRVLLVHFVCNSALLHLKLSYLLLTAGNGC